jgi:hypothetical protein
MLYTDEIVENTGDDLPIIASTRNGFRAKARESSSQRNGGKGPTADWVESFSSLSSTTLFLMARQGPTVFIVKNENDGIFKANISYLFGWSSKVLSYHNWYVGCNRATASMFLR